MLGGALPPVNCLSKCGGAAHGPRAAFEAAVQAVVSARVSFLCLARPLV